MASPLESAITLEDVFAMVVGKRVPLAPELAGYLSLEIAEKADAAGAGGGDVDPRSVYIADEGTVALVRPRGDAGTGDAEQSIRALLGQLLVASGSSTPALASVSKRARSGSLRTLMEDIEAALIPVNRAAGRRALARLAREVKRVTHGVGRNAPSARSPSGESFARASRPGTDEVFPPRQEPRDAPESRAPTRPAPQPAPPEPPPRAATPAPPPTARAAEPRPRTPAPPVADVRPATPPPAAIAPIQEPPPPSSDGGRRSLEGAADVDSLLDQFTTSTTQSEQAVSHDLKELLDLGPTAAPPSVREGPPPSAAGTAIDDLLAMTDVPAPEAPAGRFPVRPGRTALPTPFPESAPPARAPARAPDPTAPPTPFPAPAALPAPVSDPVALPARPSARPAPMPAPARDGRALPTQGSIAVADTWARPKKKRTDYWIVIGVLALLAAASAVVWLFKPGFLSGRTAEKVAEERAASERARQAAALAQQAATCQAALAVSNVPNGAEVLIRVGQAPVDVPLLPVGARLEFVATAEGFAPKRVVVPAGATWDPGADGKPRFEVAVQLDRSKSKAGDAWPPGEAGSDVGGKGPPGTVHLVSTPRGAEVWMLAGLGPDALIEQLPCDQPVDVLVAGPTTYRKRLHAAASDFAPKPGEAQSRLAKLSAK